MISGHRGHQRGTIDSRKILKFKVKMALCPRAHCAPRFLYSHIYSSRKRTYRYTPNIYTIYNNNTINYIYSIYTLVHVRNELNKYNYIKNAGAPWADGRTTSEALSINGSQAFENAPFTSTCPLIMALYREVNIAVSETSAFSCGYCAFWQSNQRRLIFQHFSCWVHTSLANAIRKKPDISSITQSKNDSHGKKQLIYQHIGEQ
jgi:hypothetical protein